MLKTKFHVFFELVYMLGNPIRYCGRYNWSQGFLFIFHMSLGHLLNYGLVKLFDLCMAWDIKLLFDDIGAGIFDPDKATAPLTGGVLPGLGDDVADPVALPGFLFIRIDE